MKKLILFLLLPFSLKAQEQNKNADHFLTAYHKQDLFTGNALIAQNGKIVFSKSYGMADREKNIQNTLNTTFRIGSISKTFTAIVILQLQEKGLLTLDDPLSKYIPEINNADSIKIKHLLSNSSGIRDFIGFVSTSKWSTLKSYKELITAVAKEPSKFSPGTKFDYSSTNFLLLCAIAEKVTGTEYQKVLDKQIIQKIGLKNTGMDDISRHDKNEAIGYQVSSKQFYNRVEEMNIGILSGAGGMYSSISDLLLFDQALYGTKLLSEKSKQLLFTPQKGNYALGWEILNEENVLSIGHTGAIDGFKSNLIRFPEQNTTLILLSNYNDIQGFELYKEMRHIALNKPFEMPSHHSFIHLSTDALKKYEGTYALNEKMTLTVTIEGQLLKVSIPGADDMVLYPETATDFYIRSNNAYGKFIADPATNTFSLQLIKGKRISEWKKRL